MLSGKNSNPKNFWSYIKSRRCDNVGTAPLMKDGILRSESKPKAEILNDQFASVFVEEDDQNLPDLGQSHHPDAPPLTIQENGVRKLLKAINPHKATGADNIPARILREGADQLAPIFTLLFQATLHQGTIPAQWKSAFVTPLFKKGDKHQAVNYRPVSLTSISCKIMEHIIHSHVISHLQTNNILSDLQHGFRKNRSCESQLLLTIHDLVDGLRNKQQIDAILLDFSKAFDKVPHRRLLLKLHNYGIRDNILTWISQFLTDRTQQVVLDGSSSSTAQVTSGVPQGTVLGPLLFLVYINDLPESVKAKTRLFADDCLLYSVIRTAADAKALQDDLDKLQEWEEKWLMKFNPSKCETIRLTNKKKIVDYTYNIHGTNLKLVDEAKYLGLTIDSKLKWGPHTNKAVKKANSTLGFLRRNLRKAPEKLKAQAYQTYVRPTIEYAATIWGTTTNENQHRIEMVQRRAARFVKRQYDPRQSVTAMLNQLRWTTLADRRKKAKVTMVYKLFNNLIAIPAVPPYITLSARNTEALQLQQHHCRILSYQWSFFPSVVPLWNSLPPATRTAQDLVCFQALLEEARM